MPELELLDRVYPEAPPASEETRERLRRQLVEHIGVAGPKTRRRRRRPMVLAAAAAVVALLAGIFVGLERGSDGTASAATAALRNAASVARAQEPRRPLRPGEFLYIKSVTAYLATSVYSAGDSFSVLEPRVREIWLGPDRGLLRERDGRPRFLSARDRSRWIAHGRPPLESRRATTTRMPGTRPLDLPSDPDALYERLKEEAEGHSEGTYEQMFTLVGDALRETSATPAQRAALYEVAARLPGVELIGRVRDPAGRPGVAVAMASEDDKIRHTLVFDPKTSVLLAEEQRVLPGNTFGYPAGTRIGHATYLTTAVVRGLGRRP